MILKFSKHLLSCADACIATFMVSYAEVEKRRPTYDLEAAKLAIGSVERLAMTSSALRDATALGFDRGGVAETILGMKRRCFTSP